MKHAKIIFVLCLGILLVISSSTISSSDNSNVEIINESYGRNVITYKTHPIISISNDSDLDYQAGIEGWDGTGTINDPYLIDGYNISSDSEPCIFIQNVVVKHVLITGCFLSDVAVDASYGVRLYNTTTVQIENTTFDQKRYSIYMSLSNNTKVTNCTIEYSSNYDIYMIDTYCTNISDVNIRYGQWGIYGYDAHNTTISNVDILDNDDEAIYMEQSDYSRLSYCNISGTIDDAISIWYSFNPEIANCEVGYSQGDGIYIYDSPYALIADCDIHNNINMILRCGILVEGGHNATILNNRVYDNEDNGITLDGCPDSIIKNNHVFSNKIHGILLDGSDKVYLENNTIYDNGEPPLDNCGIFSIYSDDCEVYDCTIFLNVANGISLSYSDNWLIHYNNISLNYNSGIDIEYSTNITISQNSIHNQSNGIQTSNSHNNTLTWNLIYNNEEGLYLSESENNTLYYNDFCLQSGHNCIDEAGRNNSWDDGNSIGNWYDDYDFSGNFSIQGSSGSLDHYPSRSLYAGHADNLTYSVGTINNVLTWNCSALHGWKYMAYKDGVSYKSGSWDGTELELDVSSFSVGTYNITVVFYHISDYTEISTAFVHAYDNSPPIWLTYSISNSVEFGDDFEYDLDAYDHSGIDTYWINWTDTFSINQDGVIRNTEDLQFRVYYIYVSVNDTLGNTKTSLVIVNVVDTTPPEFLSTPNDIQFEYGEAGHYLVWEFSDSNMVEYVIFREDMEVATGNLQETYDNATLLLLQLEVGVHNFTIVVYDGAGNSISDTVTVTVTSSTDSTSTSTTTSTTTTTSTQPDNAVMVSLAIGGIGFGVIILVIGVYYTRRKISG